MVRYADHGGPGEARPSRIRPVAGGQEWALPCPTARSCSWETEMKPFSLDDFMVESNRIEGIPGCTPEQVYATAAFCGIQTMTITHLIKLVSVYQPDAKPRFVQGLDV